jgi:hypothetical protein
VSSILDLGGSDASCKTVVVGTSVGMDGILQLCKFFRVDSRAFRCFRIGDLYIPGRDHWSSNQFGRSLIYGM